MMGWLFAIGIGLAGPAEDEDDKPIPHSSRTVIDFDGIDVAGELVAPRGALLLDRNLGATPGGAQDIRHFRDQVALGQIPLPQAFTPEGLFSEHDLPLSAERTCPRLLCTTAKAVRAWIPDHPEGRYLAQIGFTSGLQADFEAPPLTLIAVVDKSGSMSDQPITMVRATLHAIVDRLRPDDRLAIVLYGSDVHLHAGVTPGRNAEALHRSIDRIVVAGSTNLEAGLTMGFDVARRARTRIPGNTRVMLFTDERPNTGDTRPESFMALARDASRQGIGLTTIGVGTQFGAELAARVSAVRGGNLFFFSDATQMRDKVAADFDLMVTELAYDLDLRVTPAPGMRITGLYGLPGNLVEWTADGGVRLHVATLFPSRARGGIFVGFGPEDGLPPRPDVALARVTLSYEARDGIVEPYAHEVAVVQPGPGDEGLPRGAALVDMATTLTRATALHHRSNDQEGAFQLVHALLGRLDANPDPDLEVERVLVRQLDETLARLSGRVGETDRQRANSGSRTVVRPL